MRLLDRNFKYIPSTKTDVAATWRKFGFRPTTERDRKARRQEGGARVTDGSIPPSLLADTSTAQFAPPLRQLSKGKLKLAVGK